MSNPVNPRKEITDRLSELAGEVNDLVEQWQDFRRQNGQHTDAFVARRLRRFSLKLDQLSRDSRRIATQTAEWADATDGGVL